MAFLARLETIQTAVREGHPLVAIYRQLGGADGKNGLGISYSQFARYVAKYVRSTPTHEPIGPLPSPPPRPASQPAASERKPDPPAPTAPSGTSVNAARQEQRKSGSGQPRFQHNPTSKDPDLI